VTDPPSLARLADASYGAPGLPDLPFGAGFGGGPGRYSSITLLTTAMGRPGCE